MNGNGLVRETGDSIKLIFVLLVGVIVIGSIAEVTGDPFGIQEKYELIVALILAVSSISFIFLILKVLKDLQGR